MARLRYVGKDSVNSTHYQIKDGERQGKSGVPTFSKTDEGTVGAWRGRNPDDNCQTIYSFSASHISIFATNNLLGANKRFWRCFQYADNQPFEFYWHILMAGNEPERARTGLKKGHSCAATVALSAFKCGSFASSESRNERKRGLFR